MNFADVRHLVIPAGEVVMIARGSEILWRKQRYKKELLYLESTGTQYIDTGLRLNQDSKLEMRVSHLDVSAGTKVFGSRSSATGNNFSVITSSASGVVIDFYNYANNRLSYVPNGDEVLEISISNGNLKINDAEKAVTEYSDFTTPQNAYLFDATGSFPNGYSRAKMRLYVCKIYDNGMLVRDFIPVLDWNDVPCMYDKVTDELFYNKGTSEFAYDDFSKNYERVEYLESTGTQYIDTGVVPADGYVLKARTAFVTNPANTSVEQINGVSDNGRLAWGYARSVTNQNFYIGIGTKNINTNVHLDTLPHTFTINMDGNWSIDENTGYQDCGTSFPNLSVWLFARHRGQGNINTACTEKLYFCQIYDNGTLVRDFIPCYRKSDGKPGMYDKVTDELFYNKGTGEFGYA